MNTKFTFNHDTNNLLEALNIDKNDADRLLKKSKKIIIDYGVSVKGRKSNKIEMIYNEIKDESTIHQSFLISIFLDFITNTIVKGIEKDIIPFMQQCREAEQDQKRSKENNAMYQ